jgi:hypothetical protein
MNTFWKIERMTRDINTGGVVVTHWRVFAEDEGFHTSAFGHAGFVPDYESSNFVPFEDLTEEEVIKWVVDSLGEERIAEVMDAMKTEIDRRKAPTTSEGLPWA